MKFKTRFFLFFWLQLISLQNYPLWSMPSTTLVWEEKTQRINLSEYLQTFNAERGKITLATILQDTQCTLWRPYDSDFLRFGYTKNDIWLRLDIDVKSIPTEKMYWWFDILVPQEAALYHIEKGRVVKEVHTGVNFPFSQRDVQNRFLVFSFQPKNIGKTTLLAHFHNEVGSLTGFAYLNTMSDFTKLDRTANYRWTAFFGFIFFAAILSLGLWLVFNERVYIYYSCYLACAIMVLISTSGFGNEWFWGDSPILANATKVLWAFPTLGFLLVFVYRLLSEVLGEMKWLRLSIRIITSLLTLCVFLALGFSYAPLALQPYLLLFGNFAMIFTLLCILIMLVIGIYKRYKPAYFFLFAFLPVAITGIAIFMRNALIIEWSYLRSPFVMIPALLVEIIFLFVALLTRFQTLIKIKNEKLLLEREAQIRLQYERERISRDLHDNLGAQLSHIVRGTEWLKKHDDTNKEKLLESVNDTAKDAMSILRESIWTLNREHISSTDFSERLKKFAQQVIKSSPQIRLIFNANTAENVILTPEQSLQTYRILQEAINNALKYAHAETVEIELQYADNQTFIGRVKDDGSGFNLKEKEGIGNGFANMRHRAALIEGVLTITSEIGTGTIVEIRLN